MQVDNRLGDGFDDVCCVPMSVMKRMYAQFLRDVDCRRQSKADDSLLVVASALTDTIKELSTNAEVRDEVKVVHRLKVIHERHDAPMTLRHLLQRRNLISHHVFPALHQTLADHLTRIVFARLDVHCLLDDGIGPLAQRPASLVGAWHRLRLRHGLCRATAVWNGLRLELRSD